MSRLRRYLLAHSAGIALTTAVAAGVSDALISRSRYVDSGFFWLAVAIWLVCGLPIVIVLSVLSIAVVTPSRNSGWRSPCRIAGLQLAMPPTLVLWLGAVVWVNISLFCKR